MTTNTKIGLVFVFSLYMGSTFGFGLDLISAFIPDIKAEFSLTSAEIGWITGVGRFGFVVGALFAGLLVTVMSPTVLVVVAVIGCGFSLFAIGSANSSVVVAVAIFITSIFTALSWVPMTGVFSIFISEKNRGIAFGSIIAGAGVGTSLSGYLSPFFLSNYSWRVGVISAAAVTWGIVLVGLFFIIRSGILTNRSEIDNISKSNMKSIMHYFDYRLIGILFMFFLVGYSVHPFQIFLSTYLRVELNQTAVVAGNTWLTIGLVGTWAGLLMGYLADQYGIKRIMFVACLSLFASILLLIKMHTPMWFIVTAVLFSLAYYCMPGLLPAFLSIRYPPNISIQLFSIGSMVLGVGAVVGSILGGELSQYFNTLEAYYWTCSFSVLLLGLCTHFFMTTEHRYESFTGVNILKDVSDENARDKKDKYGLDS